VKVFGVLKERWLEQRRTDYTAVRWRSINQVTPFGLLRLPVRVVRAKRDGRDLSWSKVLSAPKATQLLSAAIEKRALEAVVGRNHRPAAAGLFGWVGARVSAWLIWRCVQLHGAFWKAAFLAALPPFSCSKSPGGGQRRDEGLERGA
jgi:hypothetical protein